MAARSDPVGPTGALVQTRCNRSTMNNTARLSTKNTAAGTGLPKYSRIASSRANPTMPTPMQVLNAVPTLCAACHPGFTTLGSLFLIRSRIGSRHREIREP